MKTQIKLEHNLIKINNESMSVDQRAIDRLKEITEPCEIAFVCEDDEYPGRTCLMTLFDVTIAGLDVTHTVAKVKLYDVYSQDSVEILPLDEMKIIGFSARREDDEYTQRHLLAK